MKWKRRCKNTAVSECGTYLVAGYRIGDRILYRASRGGVFVTDPMDSMDKINKALKSINPANT